MRGIVAVEPSIGGIFSAVNVNGAPGACGGSGVVTGGAAVVVTGGLADACGDEVFSDCVDLHAESNNASTTSAI